MRSLLLAALVPSVSGAATTVCAVYAPPCVVTTHPVTLDRAARVARFGTTDVPFASARYAVPPAQRLDLDPTLLREGFE